MGHIKEEEMMVGQLEQLQLVSRPRCFTLAASWVAVHFERQTCSTKAPPVIRNETMSYDLCLTAAK